MCIYILLNIVAWWPFIALSFIYIEGVYNIYLYIYNILPINVIFSFKVNGIKIFHYYMDSLRIFYDKDMRFLCLLIGF